LEYCGFASGRPGSDSQTRGLILDAEADEKVPVTRNKMILSVGGAVLNRVNFPDGLSLKKAVDEALDFYRSGNPDPDVFVLPFDHGRMERAGRETDELAAFIKDYHKSRKMKVPTVLVLTSAYYEYENVDIANVPFHLMNREQARALKEQENGRIVPTLGIAGILSKARIMQAARSPKQAEELRRFRNGRPTVFFSLGGRVEGPEIKFTLKDARNLWEYAEKFRREGFNAAFGNSARTPSDVTDYLFEKCRDAEIPFYNSKKIAASNRGEADFRLYSGKYRTEFREQEAKLGNIYPAILAVSSIVAATMDSFSYASDTAALGIKTAVYTDMEIDPLKRPDCRRLFLSCRDKYVLDLKDPRVFDTTFMMPPLPHANEAILKAVKKIWKL
jgi:mitochondrial fission protein ELM1